jgi:hypothetical protein
MMKIRRAKFNAVPTEYKGVRFASKREAAYCAKLDALKRAGGVSYLLDASANSVTAGCDISR